MMIDIVNLDLLKLKRWGIENKTTFEASKTFMIVMSNRAVPFDPTGINFDGEQIVQVDSVKLVGFTLDCKLTWKPMVEAIAKKARMRLGALRRLKRHLDSNNIKAMYTAFVRSTMEYGNMLYMGAAPSTLAILDKIQESAMKMGGFKIESLSSRREAAAVAFALRMLDGKCRGVLQEFTPTLETVSIPQEINEESIGNRVSRLHFKETTGAQVKKSTVFGSLQRYERCFFGALPQIWSKIPQWIIQQGKSKGWSTITNKCKSFLTGKLPCAKKGDHNKPKSQFKFNSDMGEYKTSLNQELNSSMSLSADEIESYHLNKCSISK